MGRLPPFCARLRVAWEVLTTEAVTTADGMIILIVRPRQSQSTLIADLWHEWAHLLAYTQKSETEYASAVELLRLLELEPLTLYGRPVRGKFGFPILSREAWPGFPQYEDRHVLHGSQAMRQVLEADDFRRPELDPALAAKLDYAAAAWMLDVGGFDSGSTTIGRSVTSRKTICATCAWGESPNSSGDDVPPPKKMKDPDLPPGSSWRGLRAGLSASDAYAAIRGRLLFRQHPFKSAERGLMAPIFQFVSERFGILRARWTSWINRGLLIPVMILAARHMDPNFFSPVESWWVLGILAFAALLIHEIPDLVLAKSRGVTGIVASLAGAYWAHHLRIDAYLRAGAGSPCFWRATSCSPFHSGIGWIFKAFVDPIYGWCLDQAFSWTFPERKREFPDVMYAIFDALPGSDSIRMAMRYGAELSGIGRTELSVTGSQSNQQDPTHSLRRPALPGQPHERASHPIGRTPDGRGPSGGGVGGGSFRGLRQ